MKSTFHLGKIAGIDIGIHYSWFFILLLLTFSLSTSYLVAANSDWSSAARWTLGLASALALFASVLIHELAHSFVAKSMGFPVQGITLFVLGGVSNLDADTRRAKDEFTISVVGPLTSLVLAIVFFLILQIINGEALRTTPLFRGGPLLSPIEAILGYLWFINLLLAIFNMLPAFPLDGGRILHSIIWAFSGNYGRATKISSFIGQGVGLLMIVVGVAQIFGPIPLLLGGIGGPWFAVIGFFIYFAARSNLREMEAEAVMQGVHVRDVMRPSLDFIDPDLSVYDVVEHLMRGGVRAMPVCEDNLLTGIISLTDVKKVDRARWPTTPVRDIMAPMPVLSVEPHEDLSDALGLLAENSIHQTPVLYQGRLIGMLTRADIIDYLHRRKELGVEQT